jgi:hypothetical protein
MASSGAAYFLAANGTLVELSFPPREYRGPRIAPDDTAVAVGIGGGPGRGTTGSAISPRAPCGA